MTDGSTPWNEATVLSWASAHGHSQLKRKKLRVGGCMEEVLKLFNYLPARAHLGCKVSCQGALNHLALSLFPCFVEASLTVEKAVTGYKADQPIYPRSQVSAAFSHRWQSWLCDAGKMLWTRPWTGVCELDVVPKAHLNNHSCECSGPTFRFTTHRFSMVGSYMEDLVKPQNCQN